MYTNNIVYSKSDDEFRSIVTNANNITDSLRSLGYSNPRAGRSRETFLKRTSELGISLEHFGKIKKSPVTAKPLSEILVENSTYTNMRSLKSRVIGEKLLDYNCKLCGISTWLGKPITLQLDHINGVNDDHRLCNLRFLCPNCHSQTATFAGRNK